MSREIVIRTENLEITFNERGGACPESIRVHEYDGKVTEFLPGGCAGTLEIGLADGRVLTPAFTADATVMQYQENGAQVVEFVNVPGVDRNGNIEKRIMFTLRHEFFNDGTFFTNAFFLSQPAVLPACTKCELSYKPDFSDYDNGLRWAFFNRRSNLDATVIQALTHSRYLPAGDDYIFDKGIFALASFNARRKGAPSIYFELFVEAGNSVSDIKLDNESAVCWKDKAHPEISWNFERTSTPIHYWRNQWGGIIRPAATKRHKPPCTMYHCMDNLTRFPEMEEIDAMAAAGCEVLTMHECWRVDAQNGGVPFDEAKFRALIERAHQHGMRITVYMRGNEKSVHEDRCSWFNRYLKYNFDGLYMDYGGPFCEVITPSEGFREGQILFREHYLKLRRLREMIGPNGVFYSHTGPYYSALAMPFMDGYTSGEGEQGLLIKDREQNEYYTMSTVSPGTLWSAAFPEYSSARMVPFLAATGQYPHTAIGFASWSSSLAHPLVPGIEDLCFRPLWKLWKYFKDEFDITFYNDFNSRGIFTVDDNTGHYLMLSKDRQKALLVLSNFVEAPREVTEKILWEQTGFKAASALKVEFDEENKLSVVPWTDFGSVNVNMQSNGVAGILYSAMMDIVCPEFPEDVDPRDYASGREYLAEIEEQRKRRFEPEQTEECYLTLSNCKTLLPASYEKSLIDDLYDIRYMLGERMPDGSEREICWIGCDGLHDNADFDDYLKVGTDGSFPVPLHELLGSGRHHLFTKSFYHGEPFYSFAKADLSDGKGNSYELLFRNDLEPDRAYLNFIVDLK